MIHKYLVLKSNNTKSHNRFPYAMDWLHQGPADGVENVVITVCNKIFIILPRQRLITCPWRKLESESPENSAVRKKLGLDTSCKSSSTSIPEPIPITWISMPLLFIVSAISAGLEPLYPHVCLPSVMSKVTWQLLK